MRAYKIFFLLFIVTAFFFFTLSFVYDPSSSFFLAIGKTVLYTTGFGALLWIGESFFKMLNLKFLNVVILGLFIGCLFGKGLCLSINTLFSLSPFHALFSQETLNWIRSTTFFIGLYLGLNLTCYFSHQILLSIPFIKLTSTQMMRREIYLDVSALADPRILDLASTGILDHMLVLPKCILKELHKQADSFDETTKAKGRRALDTLKKLEALAHLHLRYDEIEISATDVFQQLISLAKIAGAQVLISEASLTHLPFLSGVKLINIHSISHSLKPLMQAGESLKIKIQRYGKEPNQGVGYLEDGTMVVVNGGGAFIEKTIDTQVLSVKHTSSGRMIFCNTLDIEEQPNISSLQPTEHATP